MHMTPHIISLLRWSGPIEGWADSKELQHFKNYNGPAINKCLTLNPPVPTYQFLYQVQRDKQAPKKEMQKEVGGTLFFPYSTGESSHHFENTISFNVPNPMCLHFSFTLSGH